MNERKLALVEPPFDAEGEVLEVLVQARRDAVAARKLMRKLLRKQGYRSNRLGHGQVPGLRRGAS